MCPDLSVLVVWEVLQNTRFVYFIDVFKSVFIDIFLIEYLTNILDSGSHGITDNRTQSPLRGLRTGSSWQATTQGSGYSYSTSVAGSWDGYEMIWILVKTGLNKCFETQTVFKGVSCMTLIIKALKEVC